ncbi:OmpA family protein [Leadbettera azotonutricia]|uniref:Putative OmpA family protein n=1 Tax=Leadbettera azotonutricia (strain ATCC BAA-888 / DSM 13862 / ZAS-9) TaxID=545695 RepID=F5YEP9_LEAAZ|nr:OmpA family protein [Leadbettera azotonutricia]AEF81161.1 putative OmpA family protein [Leadbettera azotonutricia ZAS-9]
MLFFYILIFSFPAFSQDAGVFLSALETGPYTLVKRSDWSRYDNGKYKGHVYREVRASIAPSPGPQDQGFLYQGNFLVLEETLRDLRQSAQAVDAVIPVSFRVYSDGSLQIDDDRGFPHLRGFPAFPKEKLIPSDKWTAPGSRALDPLNQGQPALIPFIAEYQYLGTELYKDVPVYRIAAKYALRYQGPSENDEENFRPPDFKVQGTHLVDILLRVSDGLLMMMRDNLDETYTWPGGVSIRFRGFTLTFGQSKIPFNPEPAIAFLKTERKDIEVNTVPEGIRLTIKDIRFAPDSDAFLPEEQPRLDSIAQTLKQIPDRTILVEGHTAAVGRPDGELELSVQRAQRMVEELTRRGLGADRFIYKGWGGAKPLGDNATNEGRRLNRRVEITILE